MCYCSNTGVEQIPKFSLPLSIPPPFSFFSPLLYPPPPPILFFSPSFSTPPLLSCFFSSSLSLTPSLLSWFSLPVSTPLSYPGFLSLCIHCFFVFSAFLYWFLSANQSHKLAPFNQSEPQTSWVQQAASKQPLLCSTWGKGYTNCTDLQGGGRPDQES